jgi:hypothetical protein
MNVQLPFVAGPKVRGTPEVPSKKLRSLALSDDTVLMHPQANQAAAVPSYFPVRHSLGHVHLQPPDPGRPSDTYHPLYPGLRDGSRRWGLSASSPPFLSSAFRSTQLDGLGFFLQTLENAESLIFYLVLCCMVVGQFGVYPPRHTLWRMAGSSRVSFTFFHLPVLILVPEF